MFKLVQTVQEIRIMPMSKSGEFDNQTITQVQQEYFLKDLFNRQDCEYHFKKAGIKSFNGSLILFQYDNKIIASAQLKNVEKYDKIKNKKFSGEITFYKDTIQVFEPIDENELKKIDQNFKKFSNVKQFLGVNNFKQLDVNILKQLIDLMQSKKHQYDMKFTI